VLVRHDGTVLVQNFVVHMELGEINGNALLAAYVEERIEKLIVQTLQGWTPERRADVLGRVTRNVH